MTLEDLGWDAFFEEQWEAFEGKGWVPARLIRDNKISYGALTGDGEELEVIMSGKVYHEAETDADLPAVGDWVALEIGNEDGENVIRARLARKCTLSRKAPGRSSEEQVIAANVDVVTVVTDAGLDFNPRRMERYFAIIARSKAKPLVLVNKADLYTSEENRRAVEAIQALNPAADVYSTSIKNPESLEVLRRYLKRGVTMTFAGSSGVGKSSIINYLLGEDYQWVDEVSHATGKGRHTTTARELIALPEGGILVDNPGIREVHMWTDETTLRESFADIEALAAECQYADCRHNPNNAGCAIQAAIKAGKLDPNRLEAMRKLDREIEQLRNKRRKRQMTLDRRSRRELLEQPRKFAGAKRRVFEED